MYILHTTTSGLKQLATSPRNIVVVSLVFAVGFFAMAVLFADARSHGPDGGSRGGPSGGSTGASSAGGSSGPGAAAVSSATDALGGGSLGDVSSGGGGGGGSSLGAQVDQISADVTGASTLGEVSAAISSGEGSLSGFQSQATAQAVASAMNANNPGTGSMATVNSNGGLAGSHGVGMSSVGGGGNGGSGLSLIPQDPTDPIIPTDPDDPDFPIDPDDPPSNYDPEDPIPTEPTTVDIQAIVNGNPYSPQAHILTTDTVEVEWDAPGAVECQAQHAMPLIQDGAPSGSVTVDQSDFDLGQTRRYGVRCRNVFDIFIDQWQSGYVDITVPDASLELIADPETVRQGATTTIGWEITLDDDLSDHDDSVVHPMDCELFGATSASFDAADEPQGERSTTVFNFFVNTLECTEPVTGDERSIESDVEVLPAAQEL